MHFLHNILRHAFLALYIFIAISPSLPANAAAIYLPQCKDFVEKDNHYSVAVDNSMLSRYTNGITDQSEVFKISELIREDKLCIQLAAQEYKLNRMRDGASKEATRKQLLEIQGRYNEIVEERRQEEERTTRMAGIYGKITDAFYEEDFRVNKVLIDTRYQVIDMMSESLVLFEKGLEEKQDVLVDELSLELKKLSGENESELLAKKQELDDSLRKQIEPLKQAFEANKTIYKNQLKQITYETQEIQIAAYRKYADETFDTPLEYENAVKAYVSVLEERQVMYAKRSDQLFEATNVPLDILFNEVEGLIGNIPVDTSAYNQVIFMRDIVSNGYTDTGYETSTEKIISARILSDREIMLKLMAAMTSVEFSLRSILKDAKKTQEIIIAIEKGDNETLLKFVKELPQSIRKEIDAAYEGQYESIATEIEASQLLLEKILEDPNLSDKAAEALQLDFEVLKEMAESREDENKIDVDSINNSRYSEDDTLNDEIKKYLRQISEIYKGYSDYLALYPKKFEEKNRLEKIKALYNSVALTYEELNELIAHLPVNQQNLIRFSVLTRLANPLSQRKIIQISILGNIIFTQNFKDEVRLFTLKNERDEKKYEELKKARETKTYIVAGLLWGENVAEEQIIDLDATVGINLDKNKIVKKNLRLQAQSFKTGQKVFAHEGEKELFLYSKDGYDYSTYPSEKLLIKRQGEVVKNIYKYDDNKRVIWDLDNLGILVFYGYYNYTNKVAVEMKVVAHHYYNNVTGDFDRPTAFYKSSDFDKNYKKMSKVFYTADDYGQYKMILFKYYTYNEYGQMSKIQEHSPLKRGGNYLGKVTEYTYLNEELINQQKGNSLRTTFYKNMTHTSLPLLEKLKLFPHMLSSVTLRDGTGANRIRNDFYYDRLMRLTLIEERKLDSFGNTLKSRMLKSSEIDKDFIEKDYPELHISDEFQMIPYSHETEFKQTNPRLFMDVSGEILSYPVQENNKKHEEITQLLQKEYINANALLAGKIIDIDTILSDDARSAERRAKAIADQRQSSGFIEDAGEFTKGFLKGFWQEILGDFLDTLWNLSLETFWAILSVLDYMIKAYIKFMDLTLEFIMHPIKVLEEVSLAMTDFLGEAPQRSMNLIEVLKQKWQTLTPYDFGIFFGRIIGLIVPVGVLVKVIEKLIGGLKRIPALRKFFNALGDLFTTAGHEVKCITQKCIVVSIDVVKYPKTWVLKGVENDKYVYFLSKKNQSLYERGSLMYSDKFWNTNNLGRFTEGKVGAEYVIGVVERAKWIKLNIKPQTKIYQLFYGTVKGFSPKHFSSGGTPGLRKQFRKIYAIPEPDIQNIPKDIQKLLQTY